MRPRRFYLDYLQDILQATEDALSFVDGMDYPTFLTDPRTNLAVVRALEIMGEAARHIPANIRRSYPEIPWQDVVGMRNKLVHEYFGVDLEVLWRTVQEDVSPLRDGIRGMIAETRDAGLGN